MTLNQVSNTSGDSIAWVRLSSCCLPLTTPISDAKVLTGRQKPMTEIAMRFAEIETAQGHEGLGFSYSKRAGGPGQFAHAKEIAPGLIGADPSDIARLWNKLCWAGASAGRSGLSTQAIGAFDVALYDLKAKRAGLSRAKLLGSYRDSVRCYNSSGGFLHTPLDQLKVNAAASIERGIKLKVGQPNAASTFNASRRCESTWAMRCRSWSTPTSNGTGLAPHFAMELHVHLGAAYPTEPWVEHFDWLEPLFNERLVISNGRMLVPTRPGLGVSLSEQARAWTQEQAEVGERP